MNLTERRYARLLEEEKRSGTVVRWRFEPIRLRLGPSLFYTFDFFVTGVDRLLYADEVKTTWGEGDAREGWTEDSRVKWKAAAAQFPEFVFRAAIWQKEAKRWKRYDIPSSSNLRDGEIRQA